MRASVVIPAYNEGVVIDRCLEGLGDASALLVVVAANGCTDDTAARARSHGVEVVEVAQASKVAALNAGDERAGDVFPRIYLDADIELSRSALEGLVADLTRRSAPAVAMPRLELDLSRSSWLVRSFYRVYTRLPYLTEGLVGAGCYAVNAEGRARWAEFPDITADDLFVQGCFSAEERLTVAGICTARPPRTLAGLLKVRVRTYLGNREAADVALDGHMAGSRRRSLAALRRLILRRPWFAPDAVVYLAVNLLAQRRASRMHGSRVWLTDSTSRS